MSTVYPTPLACKRVDVPVRFLGSRELADHSSAFFFQLGVRVVDKAVCHPLQRLVHVRIVESLPKCSPDRLAAFSKFRIRPVLFSIWSMHTGSVCNTWFFNLGDQKLSLIFTCEKSTGVIFFEVTSFSELLPVHPISKMLDVITSHVFNLSFIFMRLLCFL